MSGLQLHPARRKAVWLDLLQKHFWITVWILLLLLESNVLNEFYEAVRVINIDRVGLEVFLLCFLSLLV